MDLNKLFSVNSAIVAALIFSCMPMHAAASQKAADPNSNTKKWVVGAACVGAFALGTYATYRLVKRSKLKKEQSKAQEERKKAAEEQIKKINS